MGCEQYHKIFKDIKEILDSKGDDLKKKEIPADPRRHILMINERLRRGVLTFDYLSKRNVVSMKNQK